MAYNLSSLPDPAIVEALSFKQFSMNCGRIFPRFPEFSALVESDPAIKLLEVAAYRDDCARG